MTQVNAATKEVPRSFKASVVRWVVRDDGPGYGSYFEVRFKVARKDLFNLDTDSWDNLKVTLKKAPRKKAIRRTAR
jgi:hypothetical protein